MKVILSAAVKQDRPGLDDRLWEIACASKEADPDITLMGLMVKIRRSRYVDYWNGHAWPYEHSPWDYEDLRRYEGRVEVHPAGKITMSIGEEVPDEDVDRLFAHELRHIGQFHRGRKQFGYLTTDHMGLYEVEPDALGFEQAILERMSVPNLNNCYSTSYAGAVYGRSGISC